MCAVVAGIRTPEPISSLQNVLPDAYAELLRNVRLLETHYHDMQDIEFTIEEGRLYMLQTRGGKRAGQAAVKIALDMMDEGLATSDQAIMMVKPEHIQQLLHPQFSDVDSDDYLKSVIGGGLPASPGAAVGNLTTLTTLPIVIKLFYCDHKSFFFNALGKIVFSPEAAEASFAIGEPCILVREVNLVYTSHSTVVYSCLSLTMIPGIVRIHHLKTLVACGHPKEF